MQLELGKIYEGKVTSIKDYGAFVEIIGENATGMVHISQISNEYVANAKDHLTEGQIVKVKFMGTNEDGKIKLSIKEALPQEHRRYNPQSRRGNYGGNNYQKRNGNSGNSNNRGGGYSGSRNGNSGSRGGNSNANGNGNSSYSTTSDSMFSKKSESDNFEDMLSRFKQHSDENLNDLKRITDRRNRTRRK